MATPKPKYYDILGHKLVPEHSILSKKEEKALLDKYKIKPEQLPKILSTDPAVVAIKAKPGDIVKIVRQSPTAKTSICYRLVIESELADIGEFTIPADFGESTEIE
ncbi:MAG: DNA-directed RNA polymerase subunit H [Candidatus Thermoplasmatota archaeon]